MLTKDQILSAEDIQFEDAEVPEWNGTVRIQAMTGMARDRYEQSLFDGKGKGVRLDNIRAKLLAACMVDEAGNLLFDESDIERLGKKSAKPLDRLFGIAQKLNGITDSDVAVLEKNLEADPSDASTSD